MVAWSMHQLKEHPTFVKVTTVNLLFNPRGAYLFQTHLKEALN